MLRMMAPTFSRSSYTNRLFSHHDREKVSMDGDGLQLKFCGPGDHFGAVVCQSPICLRRHHLGAHGQNIYHAQTLEPSDAFPCQRLMAT